MSKVGVSFPALASPCTSAVNGSDSADVSTRYLYDEVGNLVEMIDAEGQSQSYTYDRLGRLTSRTDALGETVSWSYDERGDRVSEATRESAPAVAVSWTYDRADRMTSRSADGATVSYAYDDAGSLVSASGPTGTITIEVDPLGRPAEVTPDDGSTHTTYTYGLLSAGRIDVTGTYTADIGLFGRETSITTPLHAGAFTFAWRPDGLIKTRSDPNGMSHAFTYTAGRLTNVTSTGSGCSGASCAELSYTCDRAGMRLSEVSSIDNDPANGTAAFTYDALGRLVTDDAPGSVPDQAYDWAAVLDREAKTVGATTVTTSFDTADRARFTPLLLVVIVVLLAVVAVAVITR